jgi:hypothetical protein
MLVRSPYAEHLGTAEATPLDAQHTQTNTVWSSPVQSVAQLVRGAPLRAISDAVQVAHNAGDVALRDRLVARFHAALETPSFHGGLISISHS